jgi:hypothetical protein
VDVKPAIRKAARAFCKVAISVRLL